MSKHPRLAIVDKKDGVTVIWHVQSDPDSPAILTGAWLADEEHAATLLVDVVEVPVGSGALDRLHTAMVEDIAALKKAAQEAKAKKASITVPRFAVPAEPVYDTDGFHGEPVAAAAWAHAVAAAQLVSAWHLLESQRRQRSYLLEPFGPEVRPLPI